MYSRPTVVAITRPIIGAPRATVVQHGTDELGSWLSSLVEHVGISKETQRGIVTGGATAVGTIVGGPAGGVIAGSLTKALQSGQSPSAALNSAIVPATPLSQVGYGLSTVPSWVWYLLGAGVLAGGVYYVAKKKKAGT